MTKKLFTLTPYFYGLFAILSLFGANINELYIIDIIPSVIFFILFCLLLQISLNRFVKEEIKRDLITTTIVIFLYEYGLTIYSINDLFHVFLYTDWLFISFWILIFTIIIRSILKKKNFNPILPNTLLIIGFSLFITNPLLLYLNHSKVEDKIYFNSDEISVDKFTEPLQLAKTNSSSPDIYYFVFDRYTRKDILTNNFNFDNSDILTYLKKNGFYIADTSFSNFPRTDHSIGSTLNLNYISAMDLDLSENASSSLPVFKLIEENKTVKSLKDAGYSYYHFGSWWKATRENRHANKTINSTFFSEFGQLLINLNFVGALSQKLSFYDKNSREFENINYQFTNIDNVINDTNHKFVFGHFLITHPPYVYDENGNFLSNSEGEKITEKTKYVNAVKYANSKIKTTVDSILEKNPNSIIIIQADEGPYPERFNPETSFDPAHATKDEVIQKYSILNAIYFPDKKYDQLKKNMSPINTFRIIFNNYFGTNLELLDDQYLYFQYNKPYIFIDTSEILEVTKNR